MIKVTVTIKTTGKGWNRTFTDPAQAFTYAKYMRTLVNATVKVAFA